MIRKILLIMTVALAISVGLRAQSGTLSGVVTELSSKEPIPFANISIELSDGSILTGGTTDFDGKYVIKPIPPGKYTVTASCMNYATQKVTDVQILGNTINNLDFKLDNNVNVLGTVEITEYAVPLIQKDNTVSGGTMTSEEISKMPARSGAAVAATMGGVYSEDGEVGSVRGSRSDANSVYIDGVKVRGSSSIPKSALEQVQVIMGGTPSMYGDATGGIISMTMKGPSGDWFGGVEALTSQFLDPYGYNLLALTLSGPIWSIEEKETNRRRTVAGFLASAEGYYIADPSYQTMGVWRANDDVIQDVLATPLQFDKVNGSTLPSIAFLQEGDFKNYKNFKNYARKGINVAAKVDVSPIRDLNFTLGGTVDYSRRKNNMGQMFNYDKNGDYIDNTWRIYARMSQRFRDLDNNSLIKNPYYQIQADYTKYTQRVFNDKFGDDLFKYGHTGYYEVIPIESYSTKYELDEATNLYAHIHDAYIYRVTEFTPGTENPDLARYPQQFHEEYPTLLAEIYNPPTYYLRNGEGAPSMYGLVTAPGTSYSSYSKQDLGQFRVQVRGSADINGHEFTLGFEFEQRKDAAYAVSPYGLWTLARQWTNAHIADLDLDNPNLHYDKYGLFQDTISYNRLYNESAQSMFDIKLRESLGKPKNGTEWLNIDKYNPDELKLEWFSADELFNQGSSAVSYYGYDYKGNKLTYKPTFEDFFTKTNEYGFLERPIAAFEPSYIAGYIQDKFEFKDLIFNVGLRIDRYDANQKVLKDQYLLYDAYTKGDVNTNDFVEGTVLPVTLPDDAVVYVNRKENPTEITGYRVGSVWYKANGVEVENPRDIAGENGITPYLKSSEENITADAFEDYKPQVVVMPRISFSFPISEEALFFAHYDILSKRPSVNQLDLYSYLFMREVSNTVIKNPNLRAERTIDYELGFKQKLGNTSALTLSAYYKEIRDLQQTIAVIGAYPSNYYTYGNIDFGTTKGFSITYDLRRTGNVSMRASYTLQFAKGTGSSYESGASIVMSNKPNLRTTLPLDYDQRHAFAINVDYRYGGSISKTKYNGPTIAGKDIFANTGVNFVINAGSGSPYTKYSKPKGGTIVGSMNGSRKPWRYSVNARLDRDIKLQLAERKDDGSKAKYAYMNVYIEVNNLLNTKNVLNVYQYTGNPTDDGYLDYTEYQSEIGTQIDVEAYTNYYIMAYRYNSGMYSNPRTIRLGVQFTF